MKLFLKQFFLFLLGCSFLFGLWSYLGRNQNVGELGEAKWQCASYTPFIKNEAPWQIAYNQLKIPRERVELDLKKLSEHFNCIRLYSVTGLDFIPEIARQNNLKLMLGAWVNGSPKDTWKEIRKMVVMAKANPDVVKAVIVGNETLLRKEVSDDELVSYINYVKKSLPKVPVTYADVWEFWLSHPKVAPSVDFVTIHILPYWEDEPVAIESAIQHVEEIYYKLQKNFPDKKIMIGETGWPSFGRMREGAEPSLVNQAKFVRGVVKLAQDKGWEYNLIEAFDQKWKRNSEGAVGGNWGLYFQDRLPKPIFNSVVSNYPYIFLLMCSLGLFFVLVGAWRAMPLRAALNWKVFPVISISSFALIYQAYEYFYASRYLSEWVFAAVVLLFGILVVSPTGDRFAAILLWIFTSLSLYISIIMLFDARYRMFPWAGFLPLTLVTCLWSPVSSNWIQSRFGAIFGALLIATNTLILFHETALNWQANLWVGSMALLGISLFLKSRTGSSHLVGLKATSLKAFFVIAIAFTLASFIRYRLMEPAIMNAICGGDTFPWWCDVRQGTGILIHFRFFERMALAFSILALVFKRETYFYIGLFFSAAGLVLYNFSLSAMALVIAIVYLSGVYPISFKKDPAN